MVTSEITYLGNLRTSNRHLASGAEVLTDAPVDNHGSGSNFSPTDLLATSLASCMITIMGIAANGRNMTLGRVESQVTKIMASNPRRVDKIQVELKFPENGYTETEREFLRRAALACPVAKSLHPDITQEVTFIFD